MIHLLQSDLKISYARLSSGSLEHFRQRLEYRENILRYMGFFLKQKNFFISFLFLFFLFMKTKIKQGVLLKFANLWRSGKQDVAIIQCLVNEC
jgi:hypothetical protein